MASEAIKRFEQVCLGTMAPENATRVAAERALNQMRENSSNDYYGVLFATLKATGNSRIRMFCCVMLRQDISIRSKIWEKADKTVRAGVKSELIRILSMVADDRALRRVLIDAVCQQASGNWPELTQFVLSLFKTNGKGVKNLSCGLELVSTLAEYNISALQEAKALPQLYDTINLALSGQPNNRKAVETSVSAVKALTSLLISLKDNSESQEAFAVLIPKLFRVLASLAELGDDNALQECIEQATMVTEHRWKLLTPYAKDTLMLLIKIASHKSIDPANQRLALAMIVEMAKRGRSMLRKTTIIQDNVVPIAFDFLSRIEFETKEWNENGADGDFEEEDLRVGLETLDYLACYLGPECFLPKLWSIILPKLKSSNWIDRHAALMAICATCEGCATMIATRLGELVRVIVPVIENDPHPRVRWAALNCVAHLSAEFSPALQREFCRELLPAIVRAMNMKQGPRVTAHAALCIVDFCSGDEDQSINTMLKEVLKAIRDLLMAKPPDARVVGSALSALAAVARTAGLEAFSMYYLEFMPGVLHILKRSAEAAAARAAEAKKGKIVNPQTPGQKFESEVCANAIFCASILAESAGPAFDEKNAEELMNILAITKKSLAPEEKGHDNILDAFTTIAQCLGERFGRYLVHVVPPLIEAALTKENSETMDPKSHGVELFEVKAFGMPTQTIPINTSLVQAKILACRRLGDYASNLPKGFYRFLEHAAKAIFPLVTNQLPTIQVEASRAVPSLMKSALTGSLEVVVNLFRISIQGSLMAIKNEDDADYLSIFFSSLCESIDTVSKVKKGVLDVKDRHAIETVTAGVISDSLKRRLEYTARLKMDIDDAEIEEVKALVHSEDELMGHIVGVVKSIANMSGNDFLPSFQKNLFVPYFEQFLSQKAPISLQIAGICCLSDIIETLPESQTSQTYIQGFLPLCIKRCKSENPGLRQSACYSIGVCTQALGPKRITNQVKRMLLEALDLLSEVIRAQGSRTPGIIGQATDNAISSVGKITKTLGGEIVQRVIPTWVTWLPCVHDELEAAFIHDMLCDFLEADSKRSVFARNNTNLPKIFSIFAQAASHVPAIANKETLQRMQRIGRSIVSQLNEDSRNKLLMCLSPADRTSLSKLLGS